MFTYLLSGDFTANLPYTDIFPEIICQVTCKVAAHKGTNRLISRSVNVGYKRVFHNDFSFVSLWITFNLQDPPPYSSIELRKNACVITVINRHDTLEVFCRVNSSFKA